MTGAALAFLAAGGPILWALLVLGAALGASVTLRGRLLRRGTRAPLARLLEAPAPPGDGVLPAAARILRRPAGEAPGAVARRNALAQLRAGLRRFRRALRTLNATAPMLGLLGTVSGMVQTFAALGTRDASTGVAAGIAEALLTTEVGLALAIPGVFCAAWLDRREQALQRELDELERLAGAAS